MHKSIIKTSGKTFPIYFIIDSVFIILGYFVIYLLKYNTLNSLLANTRLPDITVYSFILFLWLIFIIIIFKNVNLYTTDRNLTIPREIFKVVSSLFYTSLLIGAVIFFAQYKIFSREIFLKVFVFYCVALSGWRVIKRLILRRLITGGFHNINVLMVGISNAARVIVEEIQKNPYWGFNIIGFADNTDKKDICGIPVLGRIKDSITIAKQYLVDEMIVTISEKESIDDLINKARKMHLGLRIVPENLEDAQPVRNVNYLGMVPLVTYKERRYNPTEYALKRVFDFIFSLILLILFTPVFIFVAIMIKLGSPGPVFHIQKRAGFKGRHFTFYKFRSMIRDADSLKSGLLDKNEVKDGVIFKIRKDPRVTKLGSFLRKYSLDELPQLYNVLKGDMSLVGPRPPMPGEVDQYHYDFMQRLNIRPGITCLSQIKGRSNLTFKKWVKWDLWYINNWSFWLDIKILWWTIPIILQGRGAY